MRKFLAIAKVTALEALSEPLALLLTLSAMTFAALLPAMHYHQFGESSRMARDAGFSALFVFGVAYSVFMSIKGVRREIESGTISIALAHGVSRRAFFLAKAAGSYAAFLVFALTVVSLSVTAVNGAEIGGKVAETTGGIAKMWGPSLSLAIAAIVAPQILGALVDRFLGWRFVPAATLFALAISFAGVFYRPDFGEIARLAPGFAVLLFPPCAFVLVATAAAFRWKANAAAGVSALVFALWLPLLGNYCLSDSLSGGGTISWKYTAASFAAMVPLAAAAAMAGIRSLETRDITGEK